MVEAVALPSDRLKFEHVVRLIPLLFGCFKSLSLLLFLALLLLAAAFLASYLLSLTLKFERWLLGWKTKEASE